MICATQKSGEKGNVARKATTQSHRSKGLSYDSGAAPEAHLVVGLLLQRTEQ